MKRFLSVTVLTAFLVFLVACGSKPPSAAPAPSGAVDSGLRGSMPEAQVAESPDKNAPALGTARLDTAGLLATTRLPDLFGAVEPLAAHKGKAGILLAFVDTKCPFSNVAIREFPKVAAVLKEREVTSLLVNIGESEATVKRAYVPDAPVVYDTSKTTQKRWNVQSVPTIVLLDSAGAVAYRGAASWSDVAAATEQMLDLAAGSVVLDEAQSTIQG